MRGRFGGLLVDWWDWVAPPEAPPQELPISDTAQCSPLPFGRHNIWLKPVDSENHLLLFPQKNKYPVPSLCWSAHRSRLQTVVWRRSETRGGNLWEHLEWNWRERQRMSPLNPLCLLHPYDHGSKSCYASIWELQFVIWMLTHQSDSPQGGFQRITDEHTSTTPRPPIYNPGVNNGHLWQSTLWKNNLESHNHLLSWTHRYYKQACI